MVRMSQELLKRRTHMLEAHEMGLAPHTFIVSMAEDSTKDIEDPVLQKTRFGKEYEKLKFDWYRGRLGPNGWLRKLIDLGEIEDIHSRHIFQLRQIQTESMRMIKDRQTNSPMMRLMAMSRIQASIQDERKYLGIKPLTQPEILTEKELQEVEVRMEGDKFYNLLYATDPELAEEMIKKIIRAGGISDANLTGHM